MCAECAINLIVHSLAFMETHMLTLCLSTVYSFADVLHAYLQIFRTYTLKERKKEKGAPGRSVGLFPILAAQFAVFGLSFIELNLYTWLTPTSSSVQQ